LHNGKSEDQEVEEHAMKYAWMAIVALVAMSGAALAADDPMADTYTNTVVATDANGAKTMIYYSADGSYTGVAADGVKIGGTWKLEADKICYNRTTPPERAAQFCGSDGGASHHIGDTWKQDLTDGRKMTMTIVKGR
jgi:hypothetical protein